VGTHYLVNNLTDLLAPLFDWVPQISYLAQQTGGKQTIANESGTISFSLNINHSGELIILCLVLVGVLLINSFLLTEKIDV
jgi:hypothetical protein